jgi:aminopeptidase
MYDKRLDDLVTLIVHHSLKLEKGKKLLVNAHETAKPFLLALQKEVYSIGASLECIVEFSENDEIKLKHASKEVLESPSVLRMAGLETCDALLLVLAEDNPASRADVPPERIGQMLRGQMSGRAAMLQRTLEGEFHWCALTYPTTGYAQMANMGTIDFYELMMKSYNPEGGDIISFWENLGKRQAEMIRSIEGRETVRILANGTDLSFSIKGRTFENCYGHLNFPDGEIFTSVVEGSANGTIYFPYRHYYKGKLIDDITLTFKNGICVEADARENGAYIREILDTDEGSRIIGEFAFGTNSGLDRSIGNIMIDEKIGGTIHLALGNSYPGTGGINKSAVHWDMVLDLRRGGKVLMDGEPVLEDGKYLM